MPAVCAKLAPVTFGKDGHMSGQNIKIRSSTGGEFDCYVSAPKTAERVPAIVLASAVHGVDADVRAIADEFAAAGYIAAAPDLFWRVLPGPLPREDARAKERSQPRHERIKTGEADLADTLNELGMRAGFNGRAAVMGFCYGGPYAILGPKRLGYAAGISCHGTQMLDYIGELEGVSAPLCIIWGDQDFAAPAPVLDAYRKVPARMKNVEVHIFPGIQHGYMMPGNSAAYSAETRAFSMQKALGLLEGMRSAPEQGAMS
ncbi:MAG: dienelactone hydrolase family protein [Betaproteobacteria bacterium]|nr:dienelactone hydrolase family protein [Betaproteobacteria bacterium]